MTKLPSNVIQFAAGDTSLYESMQDYWNHYRSEQSNGTKKFAFKQIDETGKPISLKEKEEKLNAGMLREIGRISHYDLSSMTVEQAATNPMVVWAAGAVGSMLIDVVLPDTIIDSTSAYAEVRVLGLGETAVFDVKSRQLFPVSRAGRLGMREAEMKKGFQGQRYLNPEMRQITTGVNLFRVLQGLESLADFTVKALRSIETAMSKDIFDVFNAAMGALTVNATTGLRVTGFTMKDLTQLAQRVQAFMGGAQPIVLGTKVALASVLPDDPNYIYNLEDSYVTLGHLRVVNGISLFELPQVANWDNEFATYLPDDRLFIVAPGTDKLVKVVLGGGMISNMSGAFDAATLQQEATMWKAWTCGVVTSSIGAIITL